MGTAVAAGVVLAAALGCAHPDPWHNIEVLTEQIRQGDTRPPLFYARGTEFRALSKLAEAEADFRECLRRDAAFLPARKDLAMVLLEAGRIADARTAAREAITLASGKSPAAAAAAWSTLARIELRGRNFPGVLDATREALKLVPRGELDWFLLREEAFRALGRLDEAVADLRAGSESLKSTILRTAWIDALLDAGRGREALPLIEAYVGQGPCKARWLIRRARVRQSLGDPEGAALDLDAALGELELRILPEDPDPTLLVERGMAWALKKDRPKAEQELARARSILPEPDVLAPLERLLARPVAQNTKSPAP
jgi:tetratricopeptide (TPR) repeat protein